MTRSRRRINCTACGKRNEVRDDVNAVTYICGSCGRSPAIVAPVDDPSWRRLAACATPQGLQTMEYAGEGYAPAVRDARELCEFCPARDACLAAAMATEHGSNAESRWGVRGGLTAAERYRAYRRQRRAANA